jgi:hypothetical protein
MNRSLFKILLVATLAIFYSSCDDDAISSVEDRPPVVWEVLPDNELSKVKQWHESRSLNLRNATKASEIMWGTARYSKIDDHSYIISALVAEENDKVLKTAYIFKREDEYMAYVLGHSTAEGYTIDENYSGELSLFDLEGTVMTSSILQNGKTILSKNGNNLKNGISNFRTATENDPIILQEVVIEATRIESGTTWMLMTSLAYYDLSSFFPVYRYDGYFNGSHHYASPVSSPDDSFEFIGGPVINMDCVSGKFSDNKPASSYGVTIYVDQPKKGTREKWAWENNGDKMSAGHTFIRLTKNNTDGTKVEYIVGYYPINNSVSPLSGDNTDAGGFRNDNMEDYDVSITFNNVTALQFYEAVNYLEGFSGSTYNLNTQNCSDIGVGCAAAMDRFLPDTFGSWSTGGGTNPADLGEDIRAMPNSTTYTINRTGGTATTNQPSRC